MPCHDFRCKRSKKSTLEVHEREIIYNHLLLNIGWQNKAGRKLRKGLRRSPYRRTKAGSRFVARAKAERPKQVRCPQNSKLRIPEYSKEEERTKLWRHVRSVAPQISMQPVRERQRDSAQERDAAEPFFLVRLAFSADSVEWEKERRRPSACVWTVVRSSECATVVSDMPLA